MFRWHESRCSRPSIRIVGGLPCCQACDAIAPTDDIEFSDDVSPPSPPIRASWQRRRLAWPAGVIWSQDDEPEGTHGPGIENFDPGDLSCDKGADKSSHRQAFRSTKSRGCHPILPPRSIRVLDIAPGERDDILWGNFRVVQLGTDPPHYEALSYTWADASGNSQKCRAVYIGPFWDAVPITQNCADALRSVRFHHNRLKHRTLWIDAVCINQTDVMERTFQVAIMPEIYSTAAEVLVYLGLASNSSNTALETMSRSVSTNDCCHSTGEAMCQMCQNAIRQLFQRPYFKRLWVVQEIMLSRSIVIFCGAVSSSLPFSKIMELLPLDAWAVRRVRTPLGSKSDFFSLMIETNHCACQDPRDKVFALLGIPSDWSGPRVLPDYSLSLDEVAIGVASYFVQVCELGWPILMLAGQKHDEAKHLPSWVPEIETSFKSPGIRRHLCDKFLRNPNRINRDLFIEDDLLDGLTPSRRKGSYRGLHEFVRPQPLAFGSQAEKCIQISSRHACLKVMARRLCNIHQNFDSDQVRHSQGVVIMLPVPKLVIPPTLGMGDKAEGNLFGSLQLFIQRPVDSPLYRSVRSDFISAQDELYWLHGIEGYAILRPDASCNKHTLVCVSDLGLNWSTRLLSEQVHREILRPIDIGVVKDVRSALEAIIPLSRNSEANRVSLEVNDEVAVAELAAQLSNYLLKQEDYLWREWIRMKYEWEGILTSPLRLECLILELENSAITTVGSEETDLRRSSKRARATIKYHRSVAALLWSILTQKIEKPAPSRRTEQIERTIHERWTTSFTWAVLERWADITNELVKGVRNDGSDTHPIEYYELPDGCKGPDRHKWDSSWNNFRMSTGLDETIWDTPGGVLYILKLYRWYDVTWKSLSPGQSSNAVVPLAENQHWSWEQMAHRHNFRERIMKETPETSWIFGRDGPSFVHIGHQLRLRCLMQENGLSWGPMAEVVIK